MIEKNVVSKEMIKLFEKLIDLKKSILNSLKVQEILNLPVSKEMVKLSHLSLIDDLETIYEKLHETINENKKTF